MEERGGCAIFRWIPVPTFIGFVISILLGFVFPVHTTFAFTIFSLLLLMAIYAAGYKLPLSNNLIILALLWFGYGIFFALRWVIALMEL